MLVLTAAAPFASKASSYAEPFIRDQPSRMGGSVGIIDRQGREILKSNFAHIQYYGHGLFVARDFDTDSDSTCKTAIRIFTRDGNELIPKLPQGTELKELLWLGNYADTVPNTVLTQFPKDSLFRFTDGPLMGICDAAGNLVVPAKYADMGYPAEGLITMVRRQPQSSQAAESEMLAEFFDVHSQKILPAKLPPGASISTGHFPGHFSDGLIAYQAANGLQGFLDKRGRVAIKAKFRRVDPFANGIARVDLDQNGHGFRMINRDGYIISPARLDVDQFSGEFARARDLKTNKSGVVDRKFRWVIPPKYEFVASRTVYVPHWDRHVWADYHRLSPIMFIAPDPEQNNQMLALSIKGGVIFRYPKDLRLHEQTAEGLWELYRNKEKDTEALFMDGLGNLVERKSDEPPHEAGTRLVVAGPDRWLKLDDSHPPFVTTFDKQKMRRGRSERTLALPGTLPADAPIPDNK